MRTEKGLPVRGMRRHKQRRGRDHGPQLRQAELPARGYRNSPPGAGKPGNTVMPIPAGKPYRGRCTSINRPAVSAPCRCARCSPKCPPLYKPHKQCSSRGPLPAGLFMGPRGRRMPNMRVWAVCREREDRTHGESHRHRPRHHQFVRRRHGRHQAQGARERRRRQHHPVHRRIYRRRRAARRPAGQAPGRDQPGQHLLRHQAPDRPALRRPDGGEGQEPRPLQDRQGPERRRLGRGPRQAVFAGADLRLHPAEDEGDGRGQARRDHHAGRHHRPRLLQRRPAPGHQGRRQDRRPRGAAHHQRADRGGARLRPRQEEEAKAPSPSTTSAAAPSTSRSWRSATACSR